MISSYVYCILMLSKGYPLTPWRWTHSLQQKIRYQPGILKFYLSPPHSPIATITVSMCPYTPFFSPVLWIPGVSPSPVSCFLINAFMQSFILLLHQLRQPLLKQHSKSSPPQRYLVPLLYALIISYTVTVLILLNYSFVLVYLLSSTLVLQGQKWIPLCNLSTKQGLSIQ